MANALEEEQAAEIFTPGLFNDIPFTDYLLGPGISKHGLDLINRSPLHYQSADPVDSPALALGRAVHCAVLEPARFAVDYIASPRIDKRTKEGKSVWEDFIRQTEGKTLLSPEDYEKVKRMGAAVRSHPAARLVLDRGNREITAYWRDPRIGQRCRARPDYLNDEMTLVADLKTCQSAAPAVFSRAAHRYRYHVQAAWYSDGLKRLGCPVEHFVFVCVESTAPYAVACYALEEAAVELGRELYRRDLETYIKCERENRWPGYSEEIELLMLPAWAYRQTYSDLEI